MIQLLHAVYALSEASLSKLRKQNYFRNVECVYQIDVPVLARSNRIHQHYFVVNEGSEHRLPAHVHCILELAAQGRVAEAIEESEGAGFEKIEVQYFKNEQADYYSVEVLFRSFEAAKREYADRKKEGVCVKV